MAQTTTDHDTIRKWAEAREGRPARVKGTGDAKDAGLLRLDFGTPEESLEGPKDSGTRNRRRLTTSAGRLGLGPTSLLCCAS